MLKKLRNKKFAKKIWIILAIFILPAFILWGSGSLFESLSSRNYVGKAFGKKISIQEFMEALRATRIKLIMQLGEEFLNKESEINLEPLAWDRIVLLSEAKRRKIRVSDKEVADFIQNHPLFLQEDRFDFTTYKRIIEYVFRIKPHQFEEKIREDLILSKLHDQISSGINLSPEDIKLAYRKEYEQIKVDYLSISCEDFKDKISLQGNEVKNYFEENKNEFRRPVSFNLEYLSIDNNLPEKDAESAFNDAKIKELYLRAKRSRNLKEISKELNLELKQTGFFSLDEPIPGIGWSMDIINILGALKIGGMVPPIKTDQGWYLVRLKQKKESYIPSFEETKDSVKEKLLEIKCKDAAKEKLEAALEKINQKKEINPKAVNFVALGREFGLKQGRTELFKRNSYITGIGSSDIFFLALPKLEQGTISKIIETEQDMFLARVVELIPIDEQKFQEEKEGFEKTLLIKERETQFMEFLFHLRKKANIVIYKELSI